MMLVTAGADAELPAGSSSCVERFARGTNPNHGVAQRRGENLSYALGMEVVFPAIFVRWLCLKQNPW